MERKFNLERDLQRSDKIIHKVQAWRYAQALYAALCQNDWMPKDTMALLKGDGYSMSWRYAGGLVARLRNTGDYMDFYCSGIQDHCYPEGYVTNEIAADLNEIGWIVKKF